MLYISGFCFFLFFRLCLLARGILVFRPGTEPRLTTLKGRTARELPSLVFNYCSTQLSWEVQYSPVSHNDMKETPVRKPMRVKEESEKVGLKLNIEKTKIMTSGPITSWQIDGETVETVSDFILGVFKITADGDCSREIKRRLLLGRKVMSNLDSIFKSRDQQISNKYYFANKYLS